MSLHYFFLPSAKFLLQIVKPKYFLLTKYARPFRSYLIVFLNGKVYLPRLANCGQYYLILMFDTGVFWCNYYFTFYTSQLSSCIGNQAFPWSTGITYALKSVFEMTTDSWGSTKNIGHPQHKSS